MKSAERPTSSLRAWAALLTLCSALSGCAEEDNGGQGAALEGSPIATAPGTSTASTATTPPEPPALPPTQTSAPAPTVSVPVTATVPEQQAPPIPQPDVTGVPPIDAGAPASGPVDASDGTAEADATGIDGAEPGGCTPFEMSADCEIPENAVLPAELHCTGLYEAWPSQQPRCDVIEYAPAYELWTDGAQKRRWVHVPPGQQIDITAPDDFRYPVGTKFWKEFRVIDGDTTRLGETRLMERVELGWIYTSYVWSADEMTAVQENLGVFDLHGTGHTVPSRDDCKTCHSGRDDFILGWDALMLGPGATGLSAEELNAAEWVTWDGKEDGAASPLALSVPGDEVERAALGYLHSNCGISCHNETVSAEAYETGLFLRLDSDKLGSVVDTPTFSSALLRPPNPNATISDLPELGDDRGYVSLRPLDPDGSLILARMKVRGTEATMPRLGTNVVDDTGVALIQAWIESMTADRGYPEPMDP